MSSHPYRNSLVLIFAMFLIVGCGPEKHTQNFPSFDAVCTPPTTGDWVITTGQKCQDQTISVNGDVLIQRKATLYLENVTLELQNSTLSNSGVLLVHNSRIQAPTGSEQGYFFFNDKTSSIWVSESTISDVRSGEYRIADFGEMGLLVESPLAVLTNNNITFAESDNGVGIFVYRTNSTFVTDNQIEMHSGGAASIRVFETVNATIKNNSIVSYGDSHPAIQVWRTNGTSITHNTLTTRGADSWAIDLDYKSVGTNIHYNNITTYGNLATGINLFDGQQEGIGTGNSIRTYGNQSHGIHLWGCCNYDPLAGPNTENKFRRNDIHVSGTDSYAIYLENSPNNSITQSNLISDQSYSLVNRQNFAVNAAENYWGVIGSDAVKAKILDELDQNGLGEAHYKPYLLRPYPEGLRILWMMRILFVCALVAATLFVWDRMRKTKHNN